MTSKGNILDEVVQARVKTIPGIIAKEEVELVKFLLSNNSLLLQL
jgi:hypothetical protein